MTSTFEVVVVINPKCTRSVSQSDMLECDEDEHVMEGCDSEYILCEKGKMKEIGNQEIS